MKERAQLGVADDRNFIYLMPPVSSTISPAFYGHRFIAYNGPRSDLIITQLFFYTETLFRVDFAVITILCCLPDYFYN